MQAFATEFPISPETTPAAFLDAVREWLLQSPHTILLPEDLAHLGSVDEWNMPPGPERVAALLTKDCPERGAAVRYSRLNDDLHWSTEIVFRKVESCAWVSVRVTCESAHPQRRLPAPKKPVIVRMLMQKLGAAADGVLHTQHKPHVLSNENVELAASLLDGKAGCRLPVVYVSAGPGGRYSVDARSLAVELAGMAHVVVEPNQMFAQALRALVSCNVYRGTVGVYWPAASGRRTFYLGRGLQTFNDIARAIGAEVRESLANRRPLEECTWSAVLGLVSRERTERLQASGSREVQKYVDNFGTELRAAGERCARAEKEVERLAAELHRFQARRAGGGAQFGIGEEDLYPDEIGSIIRDAIKDARSRVVHDSRRQHVLDAYLAAFPETGAGAARREQLKVLLRDYRSMNKSVRKGLEGLGFNIADDGKHYKLVFQDDDRYTFTLPKSGGDHRGGLNAAGDIGRLLF